MNELLSVAEARRALLSSFSPKSVESVSLESAVGRVLAEPIQAPIDLPSFDNSSMDGFAVRSVDLKHASHAHPIELDVIADVAAGSVFQSEINPGQAARIMTGAKIPDGADAIIRVEDTDHSFAIPGSATPRRVKVYLPVERGLFIRSKSQDVRGGEVVLESGRRLRSQDVGLLAMLGISTVPVVQIPKVAIFSTGDELQRIGRELEPGQIYESNSIMLVSLVEKYQGVGVFIGLAPDREDAILAYLDDAVREEADLILTSAGVSVGAYDYVRKVVEQNGSLGFWKVNMRPGKPIAFGRYKDIPFIGLPGNPVSAFIGFEVFVRPVLSKLGGKNEIDKPFLQMKLIDEIVSDGRESYVRVVASQAEGEWVVRLTGHQGSGNLRSLVQANALLLVPSGVKSLPIGSTADVWLLDD